jgi:hypothetical protein
MAWMRQCREGLMVLGVALAVAAPASAQTPAAADDQYGQPVPAQPTPAPEQTPVPDGSKAPDQGGQAPTSGSGDDGGGPGVDVRGERESGTVGGSGESGASGDAALPLADSRGSELPFTGFDVAALVFLALALLAAGTLIRALARRRAAGDAT